jgi:hypothetical protein
MKLKVVLTSLILVVLLSGYFLYHKVSSSVTASEIEKNEQTISKQEFEKEVNDFTDIQLSNEVGSIIIKPGSGSSIKVNMDINVKASDKELADELANRAKLVFSKKGKKVIIKTVDKENQKNDIFKLKRKKYRNNTDLEINYILELPETIQSITLNNVAGSIDLQNVKAAFHVKCSIGNISSKDIQLLDSSDFTVKTGLIDLKLTDLNEVKKLTTKITTGDIKMSIPSDAKCTIETKGFMQKEEKRELNGGGTAVNAKASMGNVSVTTDWQE